MFFECLRRKITETNVLAEVHILIYVFFSLLPIIPKLILVYGEYVCIINALTLKVHRLTNIENNIQKRLLLYAIFPIFVSMLFEKHIQTSHEHQSAIQKRESDTSQYILQPK
jgi:hypothetical protein